MQKQAKSNHLHGKYISALEGVLESKKGFYAFKESDRKEKEDAATEQFNSSSTVQRNNLMLSQRFPHGFLDPAKNNERLRFAAMEAQQEDARFGRALAYSRGEGPRPGVGLAKTGSLVLDDNCSMHTTERPTNQFSVYSPPPKNRKKL